MSLSPEERRKIYEEEKVRIESEHNHRDKVVSGTNPLSGLNSNIAGLLCYVGGWVSGIIFLALEKKNSFVRFHAIQSIIVFGTLNLASILLGWIPRVGGVFTGLIAAFGLVFWIVLMVKAYQGEMYKVPVAGDIAESLSPKDQATVQSPEKVITQTPTHEESGDIGKIIHKNIDKQIRGKTGRIIGSCFAIFWGLALLIAFNFYHQYIAYYNGQTVDGVTIWTRYPLFTHDLDLWLPILTMTLALTILAHIVFIIRDKYVLRQITTIALDLFWLVTVIALISISPFDFNVIPDTIAADISSTAVTIALVLVAIGISIGIVVRTVMFVIRVATGKASY